MTIQDFLTADHQRLDALLARAGVEAGRVALEPYEGFRRGILKHIGMEEMILLPAAKKARGGGQPRVSGPAPLPSAPPGSSPSSTRTAPRTCRGSA